MGWLTANHGSGIPCYQGITADGPTQPFNNPGEKHLGYSPSNRCSCWDNHMLSLLHPTEPSPLCAVQTPEISLTAHVLRKCLVLTERKHLSGLAPSRFSYCQAYWDHRFPALFVKTAFCRANLTICHFIPYIQQKMESGGPFG